MPEAQRPRGQEAERPIGQELKRPRSQEAKKPRGQEAERSKCQEFQRPRSQQAKKPKDQEARRPKCQEANRPKCHEAKRPKGQAAKRQRGREASWPDHASMTDQAQAGGLTDAVSGRGPLLHLATWTLATLGPLYILCTLCALCTLCVVCAVCKVYKLCSVHFLGGLVDPEPLPQPWGSRVSGNGSMSPGKGPLQYFSEKETFRDKIPHKGEKEYLNVRGYLQTVIPD